MGRPVKRRNSGIVAVIALLASGLTALSTSVAPSAGATATPGSPIAYCSVAPSEACLESFTYDGAPANPAVYRVVWNEIGTDFRNWFFQKFDGSGWTNELGDGEIGHVFSITINFHGFNPRLYGGYGTPKTADPVIWSGGSTDRHIQISSSPVYRIGGCELSGGTWTCPVTAKYEEHGTLFGVVSNANWNGSTEADHDALAGVYNFRNTELGEALPNPVPDPATGTSMLVFTLQNPHQNAAAQVFQGAQYLRIPNRMMRVTYGIPDPDTATSSSLVATVAGGTSGTLSVVPEAGHDAVRVSITGVTFSTRTVRIRRGTIVPTRPTKITAKRLSRTKLYVDFAPSKPRGARPTGYVTRCVWHSSVKVVRTRYSAATVTRLRAGKRYTCRARAVSKAGYGPWSVSVTK